MLILFSQLKERRKRVPLDALPFKVLPRRQLNVQIERWEDERVILAFTTSLNHRDILSEYVARALWKIHSSLNIVLHDTIRRRWFRFLVKMGGRCAINRLFQLSVRLVNRLAVLSLDDSTFLVLVVWYKTTVMVVCEVIEFGQASIPLILLQTFVDEFDIFATSRRL